MTLSREWFSPAEIGCLGLPGLPTTKQGVQMLAEREDWQRSDRENVVWRRREGRGAGVEFHVSILPRAAKIALTLREGAVQGSADDAEARGDLARSEMWRWFDGLPETKKREAEARLRVLDDVQALMRAGIRKTVAAQEVGARCGAQLSKIYRWEAMVAAVDRGDWLPYLAPRHAGRASSVECPAEAWEMLKADYLRPEEPRFADCYRRLADLAPSKGWTLPSAKTLQRRMDTLPDAVVVLAREGADALKKLYPAQERDRSFFHALEAVNADGHKWDVFVRWPDGNVGRPVMVVFQDLYSGKILSWRIDRSENKEAVRLAFGDVVEEFGIPSRCWLDNGRNFASKWLTGGVPNRYRFKVRDEDPNGIMVSLGVEVHWTKPYSGQSKPIERAFRDFAGGLAKHPAFAGAYVGNNPMAKPENYGSKAVPLDKFIEVVAGGIAEHNARFGRRSHVCRSTLSFNQAFDASYVQSPIRKATAEQRRLWLMPAEGLRADKTNGSVRLEGNRYWAEFLLAFRGQQVVVRFDPQDLHQDLHVYRMDGGYLGAAACLEKSGFADKAAGRRFNQGRKAFERAQREMLAAHRTMTVEQVAAAQPAPAEPPAPETKIVRLVHGNTVRHVAVAAKAVELEDDLPEEDRANTAVLRAWREGRVGQESLVWTDDDE